MIARPQRIVSVALLAIYAAACGRSGPAQAAPEPVKAASGSAAAPATAKPAEGVRGGPLVRPVTFESLTELLPEVEGWTKSQPEGEQFSAYSRAEAVYRRDDSRIELEITDSALSQTVLAPTSVFLVPGYSERSDAGFKRAIKLAGQPAVEHWTAGSKRAEVMVVVGGRYVVRASGDDVPSPDPVRTVVETVNLPRLAALR